MSTSHLSKVEPAQVDGASIAVSGAEVTIDGTIVCRDPDAILGPFLRSIHEAALADRVPELFINLKGLRFVNSSAIRLLVDWTLWAKGEDRPHYRLVFRIDEQTTWQRLTLTALVSLADHVEVAKAE